MVIRWRSHNKRKVSFVCTAKDTRLYSNINEAQQIPRLLPTQLSPISIDPGSEMTLEHDSRYSICLIRAQTSLQFQRPPT